MKPLIHAKLSVNIHGGKPEDYLDIHEFLDSSKAFVPDMSHRALLHNAWGCYLAQDKFGIYRTNSDGEDYSVRDICEEHIIQDLGTIPTVVRCLSPITTENSAYLWGLPRSVRTIKMVD